MDYGAQKINTITVAKPFYDRLLANEGIDIVK